MFANLIIFFLLVVFFYAFADYLFGGVV